MIPTKGWSPRSHSDGWHYWTTSHGDREDFRMPYFAKPLTKTHTERGTKGSRNYRQTAYQTTCQSALPEPYQITTEKQTDILPKLPTEMGTEKSTKNAPKLSSKWLSPRSGHPRPYWMAKEVMARPANVIYGSMICNPYQLQLAYIMTPSRSHPECYMGITGAKPPAEAYSIVRRQDGIHVMIDYFSNILPWPSPLMVYA